MNDYNFKSKQTTVTKLVQIIVSKRHVSVFHLFIIKFKSIVHSICSIEFGESQTWHERYYFQQKQLSFRFYFTKHNLAILSWKIYILSNSTILLNGLVKSPSNFYFLRNWYHSLTQRLFRILYNWTNIKHSLPVHLSLGPSWRLYFVTVVTLVTKLREFTRNYFFLPFWN